MKAAKEEKYDFGRYKPFSINDDVKWNWIEAGETIEVLFKLGDWVKVDEIDRQGRVISILVDQSGVQYRVRYFDNAKPQEVLFYGDELILVKRAPK